MSSISVGIIIVGFSTIGDRSENDRLRGTRYLDSAMSKWKYCMRMSAGFFPLSWAVREVFFCFFLTKATFSAVFSHLDWVNMYVNWQEMPCSSRQQRRNPSEVKGHRRKAAGIYQYSFPFLVHSQTSCEFHCFSPL